VDGYSGIAQRGRGGERETTSKTGYMSDRLINSIPGKRETRDLDNCLKSQDEDETAEESDVDRPCHVFGRMS